MDSLSILSSLVRVGCSKFTEVYKSLFCRLYSKRVFKNTYTPLYNLRKWLMFSIRCKWFTQLRTKMSLYYRQVTVVGHCEVHLEYAVEIPARLSIYSSSSSELKIITQVCSYNSPFRVRWACASLIPCYVYLQFLVRVKVI